MNKSLTAIMALMITMVTATSVKADCNPIDKTTVVTIIAAHHGLSADMVADAWLTGEWFDTNTQKWNGTLEYRIKGEMEPPASIPNASVPGACPLR